MFFHTAFLKPVSTKLPCSVSLTIALMKYCRLSSFQSALTLISLSLSNFSTSKMLYCNVMQHSYEATWQFDEIYKSSESRIWNRVDCGEFPG